MNIELPKLPEGSFWRDAPVGLYLVKTPVASIDGKEYPITGFLSYLVTPGGSNIQMSSMMARNVERVIELVDKHGEDPYTLNREFLRLPE
jgi:hypothetical protein